MIVFPSIRRVGLKAATASSMAARGHEAEPDHAGADGPRSEARDLLDPPPTETVGAIKGLAASGLFTGQSQEFFTAATALAQAADAATRG
jgi:hypothetical protein